MLTVYCPGQSVLHRLPAGAKLLTLAVVSAASTLVRSWQLVAVVAVLVAVAYVVARLPMAAGWALLRSVLWFAVPLAVFQLLVQGWQAMVLGAGALLALVMAAGIVSCTTRTTEMIESVVRACRVLRPLGVDPERLGLLLALGMRAVPVVLGLAQGVREAQLARGLGASPTAYVTPLVVRSLRHAEGLGDALVARGMDD